MSSVNDVCYIPTTTYYAYSSFLYGGGACVSDCSGFTPSFLTAVCAAPVGQVYATSTTSTSTCGSNGNLSFRVLNTYGIGVIDGTKVTFTTTLGMITPSTMTNDGAATASLMIPPKMAGIATVTATAGGVSSAPMNISVSCAAAGVSAPAPVTTSAPVYTAPVTTAPTYTYGY